MSDHTPKDRIATQNSPSHDTVVVLRVPRQAITIVGLLIFNVIIGVLVYQLLRHGAEPTRGEQKDVLLPPPVTFIPPTPESQLKARRFEVGPDDDPSVGPLDAPVVMIEFSDFQCHYCGLFARETLHPLLEMYRDRIRFVYRDFVVYGPTSLLAAVAAECANEQNAFWLYHDLLFEFQDELSRERMLELARSIDLDMQRFSACLDNPAVEDEVKTDTAEGQRLGVLGTPTFFINGRVLVGAQPLDVFADVLDEELAATVSGRPGEGLRD